MKYCPNCRTQYTDDSLQYCLQDGSTLVEAPVAGMKTADFSETEAETVVSSRPPNRSSSDYQTPSAENWRAPVTTPQNTFTQPGPPKKSRTGLAVMLTIFLMLLLFSGIGAGIWLYQKNQRPEIVKNNNTAANTTNQNTTNKPANAPKSPTPTPKSNTNANAANNDGDDLPPANAAVIKKEVAETIDGWSSAAESHNIEAYMEKYAGTVDYYNKKGISADAVRSDKLKAFSQYNTITFDISNMSVTPDSTGNRATAVFDKEWTFENDEKTSAGKVRSQLELQSIRGEWLIVGEKDLKVYYTQ